MVRNVLFVALALALTVLAIRFIINVMGIQPEDQLFQLVLPLVIAALAVPAGYFLFRNGRDR